MLPEYVCQNCGAKAMAEFYEIEETPVHTCIMLETQDEGTAFSKRKLVLGFCNTCGFISNVVFDPSVRDYSSVYEDQQCFSSTFNVFAQKLATRLIKRHNLYNKKILEIGCGKGDFLETLCVLGNNSGVGIDPAYIKDRVARSSSDRLKFIQDYYSEKYADYSGDMVCCRHALEHIPNTAEFVSSVRTAIGNRLDTVVFFEVPDVKRVLREHAFWDIYYEHCSYFSPGSLARLFRFCKFEIVDISKDFDDQYLLIDAKPVAHKSEVLHELEESVEELSNDVTNFSDNIDEKLNNWKKRLNKFYLDGKRVVVWGSGSKCVSFLCTLGINEEIGCVVDINPFRHGRYLPGLGKKVMSPETLRNYKPDIVIVMNPVYYNEICQMLIDMNLRPEVISV
ncbi:MAG: SAM-dependent methyltransferase [Candidatus Bathyarchaeum sp.]|nr:MAG: SAM-dependent methyltransferase [Candidatus Bathyarchaeum sp.]